MADEKQTLVPLPHQSPQPLPVVPPAQLDEVGQKVVPVAL